VSDFGPALYFGSPELADGTHTISITVITANDTNPFILDFFTVQPTRSTTPVGAIAGGVVGGVLVFVLWYFLKKRPGSFSKGPARQAFSPTKVCMHSIDYVAEKVDRLPNLF
jgi:hypothetical protein